MRTVSIKEAKDRLTALARRVEKGETIVVTRMATDLDFRIGGRMS